MTSRMMRMISLVLALAMCVGMTFCTAAMAEQNDGKYPEYLNLDSTYPLVKADHEPITLRVLVCRDDPSATSNVEDVQWVKFVEDLLNVRFEFEDCTQNWEERVSLMFATNDMPDMTWGIKYTGSQYVTYGRDEGMFLDLAPYITEELMPVTYALMHDDDTKDAFTACNCYGALYTLPSFGGEGPLRGVNLPAGYMRMFVDTTWMEACGVEERPATLDAFVEMLRTFKEKDPMNLGAEHYPLAGLRVFLFNYIWNALGMIGYSEYGTEAVLNNGAVEIPCGTEQFREFVTVLNTLYSEELISPDIFTMDDTTARAMISEGCGVLADGAPVLACADTWDNYESLLPLTSDYQSEAAAASDPTSYFGSLVVSAKTEYPELIARFIDYMYTAEAGVNSADGPMIGQSDAVPGVWEMEKNEQGDYVYSSPLVKDGTYENVWVMLINEGKVASMLGNWKYTETKDVYELAGVPAPDPNNYDVANPYVNCNYVLVNAYKGHLTTEYLPSEVFLSQDDAVRLADLNAIISNYVRQAVAEFVTGVRPLEELDQYYTDLKNIGYDEYKQIYADAYAEVVAGFAK